MLGVGLKRDDSLDLELPLEVDDEYWEAGAPGDAFHQVGDKPSLIAGFVFWIKLSHIAATALRTLVSLALTDLLTPLMMPLVQPAETARRIRCTGRAMERGSRRPTERNVAQMGRRASCAPYVRPSPPLSCNLNCKLQYDGNPTWTTRRSPPRRPLCLQRTTSYKR